MQACNVYASSSAIRITLLNLCAELLEVIDYLGNETKPWKSKEVDWEHIKEEVVDVYHFYLQLFILSGYSEQHDYYKSVGDSISFDVQPFNTGKLENTCAFVVSQSMISFIQEKIEEQFLLLLTIKMQQLFDLVGMDDKEVDELYRNKRDKNFQRIQEKMSGLGTRTT